MGLSLEIERKFLVLSDAFKLEATERVVMRQGYLSTEPERVVRVRLSKELNSGRHEAYLTIKGQSTDNGLSRVEWEQAIDFKEAEQLLDLCLHYPIEKTRYLVPSDEYVFEVDVFEGHNKGLIVAEIELPEAGAEFTSPKWLGAEVTHDGKYANAALTEHPFSAWVK